MTIFLYATTLTMFTSSIPMRGLMLGIIKLRTNDNFILYFNSNDKNIAYLEKFFNELEKLKNIKLIFKKFSKKWITIKALLGLPNYQNINIKADLYISPGNLYFFGKKNLPLINMLADLAPIRIPNFSGIPWYGKYTMKNQLKHSTKYASKIICISNYTKNDLLNLYPNIKEKAYTIYNGIENEWFNSKYKIMEIDGFTNATNGYWIWYGYISARKNIINLLKAYKNLSEEVTKLELPKILLIGELAKNQSAITNFIKNNLSELVRIIPHQDIYRLKYLVKKSKGLLFPSYYEGFGLPVIEAFSQGKTVLHSTASSLPEIAGGLGISCDPYSIKSIKNALLKMSKSRDDKEAILTRKNWANNFTYKNAVEKFSKVIDKVLSESKNPNK